MKYKFSKHVEQEIKRRQIPRQLIDMVLNKPEQVVDEYGGLRAYQSKIDFGQGKIYLLRVIVNDTIEPPIVVTAYRTSKIDKYWRSS